MTTCKFCTGTLIAGICQECHSNNLKKTFAIDYKNPILFGTLWNCCNGNEKFVIVFDNGHRAAVCASCANCYPGPVFSLAIFSPNVFYTPEKGVCENCGGLTLDDECIDGKDCISIDVAIPEMCYCEHTNHFNDHLGPQIKHEYAKVNAGEKKALYVGSICDDCAENCMQGYLIPTDNCNVSHRI